MSSENDVPTASAPVEVPSAESADRENRIKVQFPGLMDKRAPSGFLHIDEALDEVGIRRFPEEWGQSAVWKEHPFRFDHASETFITYRPYRTKARIWKVKQLPVGKQYAEEILRRTDEAYRSIVAELIAPLESGEIESCYASQGEAKKIKKFKWSTSNIIIFYTGFIYSKALSERVAVERHPVFLNRASFEAWLNPLLDKKALSDRLVTDLIEPLTAHAAASEMKLIKRVLEEIWLDLALEDFSGRQFDRLWRDPRLRGFKLPQARPTRAALEAMEREKEPIRQIVKATLERHAALRNKPRT